MGFTSAFKGRTVKSSKDRSNLEIVTKTKVTKLLLPDESIGLAKGDKVSLVMLDDNLTLALVNTKVLDKDNRAVLYNLGDNSINSTPYATKIMEHFKTPLTNFSIETKVIEDEGVKCLCLVRVIEKELKLEDVKDEIVKLEVITEETKDTQNF